MTEERKAEIKQEALQIIKESGQNFPTIGALLKLIKELTEPSPVDPSITQPVSNPPKQWDYEAGPSGEGNTPYLSPDYYEALALHESKVDLSKLIQAIKFPVRYDEDGFIIDNTGFVVIQVYFGKHHAGLEESFPPFVRHLADHLNSLKPN